MIYNVRLIDAGYSAIDHILIVIQVLTFVASAITVGILIYNTCRQRKLEKIKLTITPKGKVANSKDEVFYLYLSFANESSLPISILDLSLYEVGNYSTRETASGNESGRLTSVPLNVVETDRVDKYIKTDYHAISSVTPIVIEPFGAYGGFFAFYEAGQDSFIIGNKTVELFVRTTQKHYKLTMDLEFSNFYDFSYRDDGVVFGRAVIGESKQNTSIPPDYH